MNEHRTEYLRRKEIQERQEKMLAEKREAARIKRQTGLMAAGIMCIAGMIMVVAPVRFHAIAGDNLTPEQQYLAANANEGVINAPSILDARLATTQGEPVTELAESLMSKGEEDFVPVQGDVLVTADVVDSSIAASEGVTSLAAYDDAPASAIEQASRGEMTLHIPLYEPATPSLYQTAVLDVAQLHDIGEIADTMLSVGDVPVQEGDGVIYDGETGILYVPKDLATGGNPLQARLLLNLKPENDNQGVNINTAHIEEATHTGSAGGAAISEDGAMTEYEGMTLTSQGSLTYQYHGTVGYGQWLLPNGNVVQSTAASACLLGYANLEPEKEQEEIVEESPAEESPAEESYAEADVAPEDPLDNKNLSTQGSPIDESGNILSNDNVVVDDHESEGVREQGTPIDESGVMSSPNSSTTGDDNIATPSEGDEADKESDSNPDKARHIASNDTLPTETDTNDTPIAETKGGLGVNENGQVPAAGTSDSTMPSYYLSLFVDSDSCIKLAPSYKDNISIPGTSYQEDISNIAIKMMTDAGIPPKSGTVAYTSNDETVVTVDKNGIVTVHNAAFLERGPQAPNPMFFVTDVVITITVTSNTGTFSPLTQELIFHLEHVKPLGEIIFNDGSMNPNSTSGNNTTTDLSYSRTENPQNVGEIIPIDVEKFSSIDVKDILRYPIFLIADPTGYGMTDDIPGMSFANSLFSKGLGLACPGANDLQIARNVTTLRQWGITSLPTTRNGVATNVSVEEALVRDFLNNGFKIVTYDTNNKAKTLDIVKDVYDAGLIFVYEAGAIDQLPNSIAVELNKYQNFDSIADLIKVFLMIQESEWNPDATTNGTSTTGTNSEPPAPVDSDTVVGTAQADTNKTEESSSPSSNVPIGTQLFLASTTPTSGTVQYVSSNDAVASVDAKGVLTAHALGDAVITITITNSDGSVVKQEMPIHVVKRTPTLVMPNKTVTMGNTALMCAEASNGANVTYTTADPSVITVDANTGKVTPLKVGTSLVTATIESSDVWEGATAQSTVTVKAGTPDINAEDIEIKPGATTSLGGSVSQGTSTQTTSPQDASTQGASAPAATPASASPVLTYSSSDPSVATVSDEGTVTAQKIGTATITVTSAASDDWQATQKEVTVTVTENPSDKTPSSEGEDSKDESDNKATSVVSVSGLGDAKTGDSNSKPNQVRTTSRESSAKEKAGMITREVGSLVQTGDPVVLVAGIVLVTGTGALVISYCQKQRQ